LFLGLRSSFSTTPKRSTQLSPSYLQPQGTRPPSCQGCCPVTSASLPELQGCPISAPSPAPSPAAQRLQQQQDGPVHCKGFPGWNQNHPQKQLFARCHQPTRHLAAPEQRSQQQARGGLAASQCPVGGSPSPGTPHPPTRHSPAVAFALAAPWPPPQRQPAPRNQGQQSCSAAFCSGKRRDTSARERELLGGPGGPFLSPRRQRLKLQELQFVLCTNPQHRSLLLGIFCPAADRACSR